MHEAVDNAKWMRGFRMKFRPTLAQRRYLARAFGVGRFVWNWALSLKREAYQQEKKSLGFAELSRRLTALRTERPWLTEIDRQLQAQSLRDLDRAYKNFFAKRTRFPKFKSRRSPQSVRFCLDPRHAGKVRAWAERQLILPGLGTCRLIDSFAKWPAMPRMVTVSRDACGDYWISFAAQVDPLPQAPDHKIGVDVGITDLAVTSEGWKSGQQTVPKRKADRLRRYQRQMSRRIPGSRRRGVAKAKAARLQREIANIRKDFVHQVSHHIATTAQVVVLETLNVKGMFANHALARALSNASMSELHRQIDYKVTQRGGTVIRVDPWEPTSKRCSNRGCGAVLDTLPLSVRSWICPSCGTPHDRDVNAARNILAVGLGKPEFTRGDWRVQERVTPFRCARLNRESTQSPASGWTACG
jgi:putative transposase